MQEHDIGIAMKKILQCLVKDSRAVLGDDFNPKLQSIVARGEVVAIRQYVFPDDYEASPYIVKWNRQLRDFWKRFRFENDMYTDSELEKQALDKFRATQLRLPSSRPDSISCNMVIREARRIVREILGDYDETEHIRLCRFGAKAAKGVPLSRSYLDERLGRLTGSPAHLTWFKSHVLPRDLLLQVAIKESAKNARVNYLRCESLDLFNVPKSFKSLRSIMPNTVVGNFYSNGLGDLIASRLKEAGLDITKMQYLHQEYARKASRDRKHVTADLSAASDSFTSWLVNALVPRQWYRMLKLGRISSCNVGGSTSSLTSFMTMGIGFTFPLQTLLFYGLIKAIGSLCNVPGTYSVYGDDLIYPRIIHKYVKRTLGKLGFLLNNEKSFVQTHFRESCGGDYFRGVDVRPYSFEGQAQRVGRLRYLSFLYRIANGLRRRWEECEIPATLYFLYREIIATDYFISCVPPLFPDYSGLKVNSPSKGPWFSPVQFNKLSGTYHFFYLREVADRRFVLAQRPYLWDTLRCSTVEKDEMIRAQEVKLRAWLIDRGLPTMDALIDKRGKIYGSTRDRLYWVKILPKKGRTTPGAARLRAQIAKVLSNRLVKQTGQSADWSEAIVRYRKP